MVVASSQDQDISYIVPAHLILQDVNERVGGRLGRPEDMLPTNEVGSWPSAMDEDVICQP